MFFITRAFLRVAPIINSRTELSTAYDILNQKMFDRYGPLTTDPVEVHGRDPHLPAHLPPHPPSARVAVKQCCATLHKRLQSCKLFRVTFLFPNATHENAFSIG